MYKIWIQLFYCTQLQGIQHITKLWTVIFVYTQQKHMYIRTQAHTNIPTPTQLCTVDSIRP